jgi:hypothetical protein
MVNSLFYTTKQEKTIEKNNVNIHFITGFAGLLMFLYIRWNEKTTIIANGIWDFNHMIIRVWIPLMSLAYYFFFQMASIIPHCQLFLGAIGLMVFDLQIPHNCHNWIDFFLLLKTTFNLYMIINGFNYFFQINHHLINYNNKLINIGTYGLVFLILFFLSNLLLSSKQIPMMVILLGKLWLSQIIINPRGILYQLKYLNLLTMITFANSYFSGNFYTFWDLLTIGIVFFYGVMDNFFNKYGFFDNKNIFNDNLLKFLLFLLIGIMKASFLIYYDVVGLNDNFLAPIGLMVGFPLAYKIKHFLYGKTVGKKYNYQSLIINILITFLFIAVFLCKFHYNYCWNCPSHWSFFLLGFFNSWAIISGFSRMLLTFLVGFIINIPMEKIILINYLLLFCTSIGQWLIFQWQGPLTISNIHNNLSKKIKDLLLLFGLKNHTDRSWGVILLIMVWSLFLMYKFLPALYTYGFWRRSIGFRFFIAGIFMVVLYKKDIDTKF